MWKNISNTVQLIKTVNPSPLILQAELFNELTMIKRNLKKNEKVEFLNLIDEKWAYIYGTANVDKSQNMLCKCAKS